MIVEIYRHLWYANIKTNESGDALLKNEIPKILSPLMDVIFKLLMGTEGSKDLLTDFLLAVLNISPDELEGITIANPFLLQEYKGDKLGILDVKLKLKTGKVINIEVQVDPMPFMESRILFYVSKLITEQIGESEQYGKIKRVISIIITDHQLVKQSEKYHHQFGLYDIESGVLLTDGLEIHTLEVPKARKLNESADKEDLLNWMKFFDVKTEEELKMLAQKSPTMQKASLRLMELSADEKARQLYEARLKEQRDIFTREYGARQDERHIIARKMLMRNRPIEEIVEDTGLTYEEAEALQNADY
jgi:predicted transposase/invertase (TIGR01784 family)